MQFFSIFNNNLLSINVNYSMDNTFFHNTVKVGIGLKIPKSFPKVSKSFYLSRYSAYK